MQKLFIYMGYMKFILKTLQSIDNLVTYIFSNLSKENIFIKNFFGKKKNNPG